jgi:hypothetical protein
VKRPRLWALLGLAALAAAGGAWLRLRPPPLPPPPTAARLEALRTQRDELRQKLQAAVVAHGEKSLADAPRGGLMIGIPTSFTTSILAQVVTGLFGETTLTLRNLKVHKEGAVKAKVLLRKQTVGEYVLDVQIHRVQGLLRPSTPKLAFGTNKVDLTLPVRLAEGEGEADLRLKWDSKGVANMVCGDVDVTHAITGGVVPKDYELSGSFRISAAGNTIVLHPRFPDLAVRIFVDPSEQAWAVVDTVVKGRPKGCEIALQKVDIKEKLGGILGKGFNVKIPQKIFKPIRLPAGVSQSLEVQGIRLALEVKPTAVLVASDRLWYGADVSVSSKAAMPARPAAPAKRTPAVKPAPAATPVASR